MPKSDEKIEFIATGKTIDPNRFAGSLGTQRITLSEKMVDEYGFRDGLQRLADDLSSKYEKVLGFELVGIEVSLRYST